jgi:hypothetical protein
MAPFSAGEINPGQFFIKKSAPPVLQTHEADIRWIWPQEHWPGPTGKKCCHPHFKKSIAMAPIGMLRG